jgi:hypothetical protein
VRTNQFSLGRWRLSEQPWIAQTRALLRQGFRRTLAAFVLRAQTRRVRDQETREGSEEQERERERDRGRARFQAERDREMARESEGGRERKSKKAREASPICLRVCVRTADSAMRELSSSAASTRTSPSSSAILASRAPWTRREVSRGVSRSRRM